MRQYCQFDFKTFNSHVWLRSVFFTLSLSLSLSWKFIERFTTHLLSTWNHAPIFNFIRCCLPLRLRSLLLSHARWLFFYLAVTVWMYHNRHVSVAISLSLTSFGILWTAKSVVVSQSSSRSTCFESIFRNFSVFKLVSARQDKTDWRWYSRIAKSDRYRLSVERKLDALD